MSLSLITEESDFSKFISDGATARQQHCGELVKGLLGPRCEIAVIVKQGSKVGGQKVVETKPQTMKGTKIDYAISGVGYVSKNDIPK